MKVKRFFAPDMRQGIRLVREEMGADAVILSNRKIAGGIEIVATCEYAAAQAPEPAAPAPASVEKSEVAPEDSRQLRRALGEALTERLIAASESTDPDAAPYRGAPAEGQVGTLPIAAKPRGTAGVPTRRRKQPAAAEAGAAPVAVASAPAHATLPGGVQGMEAELRSMRELLNQCFGSIAWERMAANDPGHALLVDRFVRMGFDGQHARNLAESCPVTGNDELDWRNALGRLSKQIPVVDEDLVARGGMFALVGPAGSGKTTTIGKLAARYALQHGAERIALVTTDSYRIAAHEHLRAFGRILNIPVRIADPEHPLEEVLHSLRDKSLVLVDTAGLHPAESEFDHQVDRLARCRGLRSLLVLPATSQSGVLGRMVRAHAGLSPVACILTKLDESARLGDALAVSMAERLPVAYLSDGQRVPHDLRVARAYSLVSRAVALMQEAPPEDFAHALGRAATGAAGLALQAV